MGPILLPIWRYTPPVTRPLGRVTSGNTASDASIGRVTVYEASSASILVVFPQSETDYAGILLHFLQYEADSAANLPFIFCYMKPIVLPFCSIF